MDRHEHNDESEFSVERQELRDRTILSLFGVIDEFADLSFFGRMHGKTYVDLAGIRRINSFGVRIWVDAVRQVTEGTELHFVNCSPPMLEQVNMVQHFFGSGIMDSFQAPMICEECDELMTVTENVDDVRARGGRLDEHACPTCGKPMLLDDLPEQYLAFLSETK